MNGARFVVLASGSGGNAALLSTPSTRLLLDAGLSVKELSRRLVATGETIDSIDAVVITHEHVDHIGGLGRLIRARIRPLQVWVSHLTRPLIERELSGSHVCEFQAGSRWKIGSIAVQSFTIPHDAIDPVGFCFYAEGRKIGFATDLGYIPQSVKFHLRDAHVVVLEANHDSVMLQNNRRYPQTIKDRIASRTGHLSNALACSYLAEHLSPAVETLILAHLSEENNHPEMVRAAASRALAKRGITPHVIVADQHSPTDVLPLAWAGEAA